MTQRIGTGANSEIEIYAVTCDGTPRQLESNRPVGSVLGGGLTVRAPSLTASLLLSAGPVNPGRFYVQGATIINSDNVNAIQICKSASGTAASSVELPPKAAIRLDVNQLSNVFLWASAGNPVAKIVGT